jgi:methionyl-tRNA formyltransferase
MKILFLANKDLASNFALNRLLPKVSKNNDVHLWLSANVGKTDVTPTQLKSLKFFEQDLFIKILSPLISKSGARDTYKAFDDFHCFLSSELREVNQINSPEIIHNLETLSPDLIVSIRYGGILKETVINIPKRGVLNLHSGILPKYKGVMATFWALKNNDSEIGTTLHTIDNGSIDTGHIVKISKIKSRVNKSYLWHVLELYKQGSIDVADAIESLKKGKMLNSQAQGESHLYFTFPNEIECTDFEDSGLKILDEQDYLTFIKTHYL